ncbi:ABC transporter ATP-binding protein [Luteimonas sp. MC1782]|uniref:ABC transporter ATP-binding protein n=1 Tax=Luteimonas sp. MC1782 TaxID=2760305 RepID=UPI001601F57C|nr:ABC transporter ATP-binding protein [Luteimonas sp. MC1782]MBB1472241.1 ABC transporter ATP-binding protein [Luteimonas sp. MC1782]
MFLLMLVGSLAEIVTIGAVVPFITLLARPELAAEYPALEGIFLHMGWQDVGSLVLPMSAMFLGVVATATAIRLLLIYLSNKLVYAIGQDIGVKLFRVILHQPYAFHLTRNTGDVLADVNKVQMLLGGFLRPAMDGAIALILSIAILVALMVVNAVIALSAGMLFAAIYFAVIRLFRSQLKVNSKVIAETQGRRIRVVQEGLGGIRDVLLDGNQDHYEREFNGHDRRLRRAQAANAFLGQAPRFVVEAIGIAVIVALAYALSLQPGGLLGSLPILAALALGAARLLPLIQKIYLAWAQYTGNFNVFVDVLSALNLPMIMERDAAPIPLPFNKEIRIEGISFRYAEDEPDVLTDINLTIPKGSRVGIVGKTGSGKSTLMDIVMGLLDPSHGRFLVDGASIDGSNRNAWRDHIAHVPQHIYLSDTSIAENIALGIAPDSIDHVRLHEAARQAQIADFIEAHRQGYDAKVGERGVQLSGGQRQRIGIARALYKQADVLVFDEASSALDTGTEAAVMEAVGQLGPELTVIIIAHRVQTLRVCDLVLRLDEGRVVSAGSYEDVIEQSASAFTNDTNH